MGGTVLDRPPHQRDEIAHLGDRVVTRWTRCTDLTNPLTATGQKQPIEQALAGTAR